MAARAQRPKRTVASGAGPGVPPYAGARANHDAGTGSPTAKSRTSSAERPVDTEMAANAGATDGVPGEPVKLKESDDRFTWPTLVDAIEESFGPIDFDPCWHPASAVRPKAYVDVREGGNGLIDEWKGRLVFANPPWSLQDKFLKRAHDQWSSGNAEIVICLVPSMTDPVFFHETLARDADVYFLLRRPRFFKVDGSWEPAKASVMIVMFGADAEQRRRFAELVPGSWWLPGRRAAREGTVEPDPRTCAAPAARDGTHLVVLCGPTGNPSRTDAAAARHAPSDRGPPPAVVGAAGVSDADQASTSSR